MKVHEPGECFDRSYGADCDGIAHLVIDPYAEELFDEVIEEYMCPGVYAGRLADI